MKNRVGGVFPIVIIAAMVMVATITTMAGMVFAHDDKSDKSESFNWITAKNGRSEFRNGFTTTNITLAAEFVVTGINEEQTLLTINGEEYRVLTRAGRYYSNEENPNDTRDMPASAQIIDKNNNRLFAAKGYKYNAIKPTTKNNAIIITHWNGTMGCTLTQHHLTPTQNNESNKDNTPPTTLTPTKTQTLTTKDYTPCGE